MQSPDCARALPVPAAPPAAPAQQSMIIQCPACGARAKLPDSKEGAKVRCSECERVYVARNSVGGGRAGSRGKQNSSAMPIGIGAAVVALVLILVMISNRDSGSVIEEIPEVEEVSAPVVLVDQTGWDSELVKFARSVHDAAFNRDEYRVQTQLAMPQVWARLKSTAEEQLSPAAYQSLPSAEVDALRSEVVQALLADDPENLVGSWKPFDGEVAEEDDSSAVVHLAIEPRVGDSSAGTRHIEWRFLKDGGKWKAWSWERWYSEAELKADRVRSSKKIARTVLSDGSQVIEGEPGPIPYLDETTPETRKQIDGLIAKLVDINLPGRESNKVKEELLLYWREAIPPLLTKFYEMNLKGFEDMDDAIAAQQVHQMLSDITGYVTTFKAHEALGASAERRDSGVRQWFGWYHRKFKRFDGREEEADLLDESIEFKTDAEKREYEKYKRQIEQEKQN